MQNSPPSPGHITGAAASIEPNLALELIKRDVQKALVDVSVSVVALAGRDALPVWEGMSAIHGPQATGHLVHLSSVCLHGLDLSLLTT
jgi:uncharacterized protein (UPF0210 family)